VGARMLVLLGNLLESPCDILPADVELES